MENYELKKKQSKIHDIIKFQDFGFDNLLDEESFKNILIHDISDKTLAQNFPYYDQ